MHINSLFLGFTIGVILTCVMLAISGCASPRQMTDREGAAIAEWIKRQ